MNIGMSKAFYRPMLFDYVLHDMTVAGLMKKYDVSRRVVMTVVTKFNGSVLRQRYHQMAVEKGISEASDHDAIILTAARKIMARHMLDILKDFADETKRIPKSDFESALKAFQTFQKEHRLDHDEPTENIISKVEVSFVSMAPVITDNHLTKGQDIIDVTPIEKPPEIERHAQQIKPEEVEDPKPEEVEVETSFPTGPDTILDSME